jgi:azurin
MDANQSNAPLQVEMTALQLHVVCGEIRLALRHPGNKGASSDLAADFLSKAEMALVRAKFLTFEDVLAFRAEQKKLIGGE